MGRREGPIVMMQDAIARYGAIIKAAGIQPE
jgi:hypothetical protein